MQPLGRGQQGSFLVCVSKEAAALGTGGPEATGALSAPRGWPGPSSTKQEPCKPSFHQCGHHCVCR